MPVNYDPARNPETLPQIGYLPAIALPTVFNDALTYAEYLGKVVALLNKTTTAVNELSGNVSKSVQEIIKNAKVPAYFNLLHNGSVLIDTDNWYLENPEGLYNALSEGKLCIVEADCAFNSDGYAVPDADNHVKFILTQVNESIYDGDFIKTISFVNIDEYLSTRIAEFTLTKSGSNITAQTNMLFEVKLVSKDTVDTMNNTTRNKVMLYTGASPIPDTAEQYIELTSNGTFYDLSEFFACVEDVAIYASTVCPCVVLDVNNGNIGILTYGDALNPWVRIYSTGLCTLSGVNNDISSIEDDLENLTGRVGSAEGTISSLSYSLSALNGRVTELNTDLTGLDESVVKFIQQSLDSSQKSIARNNIEAVARVNPVMRGILTIMSTYYNLTAAFDDTSEMKILVISGEGDKPIIRGIRDPLNDDDVATKGYVDNNGGGGGGSPNAVQYVPQTLSDSQQLTARVNIQALEKNNPSAIDSLTIQQGSGTAVTATVNAVAGTDYVNLVGDNGNPIIRGVANPLGANDATNKQYVDSIKPFIVDLYYDGYNWETDTSNNAILTAMTKKQPIIGYIAGGIWQGAEDAYILFDEYSPNGQDYFVAWTTVNGDMFNKAGDVVVYLKLTDNGVTWGFVTNTNPVTTRELTLVNQTLGGYINAVNRNECLELGARDSNNLGYDPIVKGVGDPLAYNDAANKKYVDDNKPYIVTFEGTTENTDAVCNRTLTEVLDAISAGRHIIVRWYDRGNLTYYYANLTRVKPTTNKEFVAQCVTYTETGASGLVQKVITCGIDTNNPYVHVYPSL